MNNLTYLARFGHGGGAVALLTVAFLVIVAVAIIASIGDRGADKK